MTAIGPDPAATTDPSAASPPSPQPAPQPAPQPVPGPSRAGWPASGHRRIVIVGAGFGGLAVAHQLRTAGIEDFAVLDRGDSVGGTWRDNTYPGCGCDIASHLYSFSFAPNPTWSRSYSRQPEIHEYLKRVAREQDLERFLVLGVEIGDTRWDDDAALWRLTTSLGDLTADVVVGATGPLSVPVTPDLPGLDSFPGPVWHTARWRHDVDLRGKRIGVIGTGASAVQVVPEIQPEASRLTIFQRTPPWVLPKGDRSLSKLEHALYQRFPWLTKVPRAGNWVLRESTVGGFVLTPGLMRAAELVSRATIKRQVKDPALHTILQPHYRLGCKRVLPSNTYYPALNEPNVELVPAAVTRFEASSVVAADGSRHELDVVIFGTGFQVADPPVGHHIFGKDGRSLAAVWSQQGRSALRMTTIAGFPNLFMVLGPNSGLGHTSMIYVIESQAAYIVDAIQAMEAGRIAAIEPRAEVQARYNATLQRRMKRTVWITGGCASWYQDPDGRVTSLWPGSTVRLRHDTRKIDLGEYHSRRAVMSPRPTLTAAAIDFTVPRPRERRDVLSADGTRIDVQIYGQEHGPTVVLVHGWTCSTRFWALQLQALVPKLRVVAYDQRGHGASGAPGPGGFSTAALADDLSAVLDATLPAGTQAVLAGHSMGAMTMIAFGGRHPEQLRRQVAAGLMASTGMSQLISRSRIVPMPLPLATVIAPISARVIALSPPGGRVNGVQRLVTKYAAMSRAATRPQVDFCARIVGACPPRTRSGFARMLQHMNLDSQVAGFDVPVVVVAGARDKLTPVWHTRRLAAQLPRLVQEIEVSDAGHMTPVQSAEQVNTSIFALVADHLPAMIDLTSERDPARPGPASTAHLDPDAVRDLA